MAKTTKVWDGASWRDLQGPAGPTVISTDAGNVSKLGTDGHLLVAQADLDLRYVNVTGDTMTGALVVERDGAASTVSVIAYTDAGNAAVAFRRTRGTKAAQTTLNPNDYVGRLTYAAADTGGTFRTSAFSCQVVSVAATGVETQYNFIVTTTTGGSVTPLLVTKDGISVTGSIVGERPFVTLSASRSLTLADRSANIANVSTGASAVTITIPTNATAAFPIGSRLDIFDLSPTSSTVLEAAPGVTLTWNAAATGAAPAVAGGLAASIQLQGPLSRLTVIKTAADSWVALS